MIFWLGNSVHIILLSDHLRQVYCSFSNLSTGSRLRLDLRLELSCIALKLKVTGDKFFEG